MAQSTDPTNPGTVSAVAFPDSRLVVVTELLGATVRIIGGGGPTEPEEAILGKRHDHIPKAPGPVLLRYYERSFGADSTEVAFERRGGDNHWRKASFGVRPMGFPKEVYRMQLAEKFFAGLAFERAFVSERPDERLKLINVHSFRVTDSKLPCQVLFESHPAASDLQATRPGSFHKIVVSRIE